jgi:hypothetical protein
MRPPPRPGLHPALRWGLLVTLLATAWFAIRAPADPAALAEPVQRLGAIAGPAAPAALPRAEPASPAGWPSGPRPRTDGWPLETEAEARTWGPTNPDRAEPTPPVARADAAAPTSSSFDGPAGRAGQPGAAAAQPDWRLVGQLALASGAIASTLVRGSDSVVALPGEALDSTWSLARAEPGAVLLVARGGGAGAAEHWLHLPEAR